MLRKPKNDEVPPYFIYMLNQVPDEDILGYLTQQRDEVSAFILNLSLEKSEYQYQENKWTPKQIINHITDMERVQSYRALCFARNDQSALPSVEENDYAEEAKANLLTLSFLNDDFVAVRNASLSLFKSLRDEVWNYNGNANNMIFPLKAIPFFVAGHTKHHIEIIKERYLN